MTNELGHQLAAARRTAESPDDKYRGTTLGGYRRSKWMPWIPGAVIDVWRPCARQEQTTGVPFPHAYFLTTIGAGGRDSGSIHCPPCRAYLASRRASRSDAATAPPVGTPAQNALPF